MTTFTLGSRSLSFISIVSLKILIYFILTYVFLIACCVIFLRSIVILSVFGKIFLSHPPQVCILFCLSHCFSIGLSRLTIRQSPHCFLERVTRFTFLTCLMTMVTLSRGQKHLLNSNCVTILSGFRL